MPKVTGKFLADVERKLQREEHLELLKQAIAANIEARVRHDLWLQQQPPRPFKVWRMNDLMATPDEKLHLDAIAHDPVLEALQTQLRKLGKDLFRLLGSTDAMLEVAEEIAQRDPKNWQFRINLFDKNWDGLGTADDLWVA